MGKFNFKNQEDFEKVKNKSEVFYHTIKEVMCPYFEGMVSFNIKGLKHLKFKADRQAHSHKDQYSRLKLLHLVPEVLQKSHTVQGIWETRIFEDYKADSTNNQWKYIMKDVRFYEFIAVLQNIRIKIIIKQVIGGDKHFWSVIPFWGINKNTSKRILHSGNPRCD